jgi:hypothetical protein
MKQMATDLPPLAIPDDFGGYGGGEGGNMQLWYLAGFAAAAWVMYKYVLNRDVAIPIPQPSGQLNTPEAFYGGGINSRRVFVETQYPVSQNNPPRMSDR